MATLPATLPFTLGNGSGPTPGDAATGTITIPRDPRAHAIGAVGRVTSIARTDRKAD